MRLRLVLFLFFIFSEVNAQDASDNRYISLFTGYGALSSQLTGSGFNADMPAKGAMLYGLEASYQPKNDYNQYILKYEKISADQDSPSGVSPSKITTSREEIRFLFKFSPWDSGKFEKLRLGIGYAFLESDGTITSPNNVVTKQNSQGIVLNGSYVFEVHDIILTPEISFYLPHRFRESQQTTGYNPNYIGFELKLNAEHAFTDSLMGFIGVTYRLDTVSFDGSGDRGVTSAKDERTYFSIPMGIKIIF